MTNLAQRAASIRAAYYLPGLFDDLRQVGEDKFRGACPMHGGDNISGFGVSRYRGEWRWRCFTGDCGFGDAIDLVMRREGCSVPEAVDILDGGRELPRTVVRAATARTDLPEGLLICDACRSAVEVRPRTYGNGGSRPKRTETMDQAVLTTADSLGWELSSCGAYAICPLCLEIMTRHALQVGPVRQLPTRFRGNVEQWPA